MTVWLGDFWSTYSALIFTVGVNGLLALSIWLTLACGLLSLANAAFMGIGAYVAALLTLKLGWPYEAALTTGALAPAAVALAIGAPTLRLSGVYLAMATLAFGEVTRVIVLNLDITGGPEGLNGIPLATEWWHIAAILAVVVYGLARLRRSHVGRAFEAIKEDEVAARLMGIDVDRHKLFAFVLGAVIAGLAGGLNAHYTFFISPQEYGFENAVDILTMAVLGGISSLIGPLVGATLLTLLPELLRFLHDYRGAVNGVILVLVVLFLPTGIWDPKRIRAWWKQDFSPIPLSMKGGDGGSPPGGGSMLKAAPDSGAEVGIRGALLRATAAGRLCKDGSGTPFVQRAVTMLAISNVGKSFGGLRVLEDVSFDVPAGNIFGLIGPNGAGKTTVFNIVTGLLQPSSGTISFQGRDLAGTAPHFITRLGIARTFQNIRIFKQMTLLENVMIGMHHLIDYGPLALFFATPACRNAERRARERALELLSWLKLEQQANMLADNLSYGDQRKLEFARALATEPKLLLLDEPVAGMNSAEKTVLMDEIRNIRNRGYGVFVIEHDMRFVMGLCDRIAVLNFGRIIAEGSPDEIRNNPDVIEAYLGKEGAP